MLSACFSSRLLDFEGVWSDTTGTAHPHGCTFHLRRVVIASSPFSEG